jgi:hypothetical protein
MVAATTAGAMFSFSAVVALSDVDVVFAFLLLPLPFRLLFFEVVLSID